MAQSFAFQYPRANGSKVGVVGEAPAVPTRETGVMLLNLGFANHPANVYYSRLRGMLADALDLFVLGVEYAGICQRSCTLEGAPPTRGMHNPDTLIVEHRPADAQPLDYGLQQAVDLLGAVRCLEHNTSRVYAVGSSLGGLLVQMANKLAPGVFAAILDVSGPARLDPNFLVPGARTTGVLDSWNTTGTFINANHGSVLDPDEHELRDLLNPDHFHHAGCQIRMVTGSEDRVVPLADKHAQQYLLGAELTVVTRDSLGPGMNHAGHSLGAEFHNLLPPLLRDLPTRPGASWFDHELRTTSRVWSVAQPGLSWRSITN